ncbi:hypothetical protein [Methylobacterium oryzisoli]|uniref:hypothetical protein n=1 Tax=Methylobacterium oryzisoli TaxID=3385502 RepID=UPI003892A0B3
MTERRSLAEFPREAMERLRLAIRRRLVARGVPEIEMEARIDEVMGASIDLGTEEGATVLRDEDGRTANGLGLLLAQHLDCYVVLERRLHADPEGVRAAARESRSELRKLSLGREVDAVIIEAAIDLYEEVIALAGDVLAGRAEA